MRTFAPATGARSPEVVPRRRIACVYKRDECADLVVGGMDYLRFFRMSEALASRGHQVDIILNRRRDPVTLGRRLREVPFRVVRWDHYDVVKTFFHDGFETLLTEGGGDHPFILSKLGSVVGRDQTPGVHFFREVREQLFQTQQKIARRSRGVTVLTRPSRDLWRREHGTTSPLFEVPTGVDAEIPPLGGNPYRSVGVEEPVVLYAGNLYLKKHQPEVNKLWQDRLNRLGWSLRRRGLRLVAMGRGETELLDPRAVLHVGVVECRAFWDWQRHAAVGVVLAQGPVQDNESSKIYYYLRTGLPVICERPVPNAWLIEQTHHGALVDYDDVESLAEAASWFTARPPQRGGVIDYMIDRHSWAHRARLYDAVLAEAGDGSE